MKGSVSGYVYGWGAIGELELPFRKGWKTKWASDWQAHVT